MVNIYFYVKVFVGVFHSNHLDFSPLKTNLRGVLFFTNATMELFQVIVDYVVSGALDLTLNLAPL